MRSNLQQRVDGVKLAAAERTFRQFGLSDLFRSHYRPPPPPGGYHQVVEIGKSGGDLLRDMYFGSPLTFLEELKKHKAETGSTLGALKKYYKNYYFSPGASPLLKVLSLGIPAASLVHTLAAGDPRTRREDLASNFAGIATSPLTMRLGLPGAAVQGLVSRAAREVARRTRPATEDQASISDRPPLPEAGRDGEFE